MSFVEELRNGFGHHSGQDLPNFRYSLRILLIFGGQRLGKAHKQRDRSEL